GCRPVRREHTALIAPHGAAELDIDLRNEVRAEAGDACDEPWLAMAPRIGGADGRTALRVGRDDREFRQLRSWPADVLHGLPGVDAALERQTVSWTRDDVDEKPV